MTSQTFPHSPDGPHRKQRYDLAVPTNWPHVNGPLHGLLDFQDGKCAICATPVVWSGDDDPECVARPSLRQLVDDDGLLLGLVCRECEPAYKTHKTEPTDATLAAFEANPPGQRFPATAGLGRQKPPRPFNSELKPTEVPTSAWSYANTVIHSLFLWQRGRCAICASGLTVESKPSDVHVDHDTQSGLIRGLLCRRCNICLGQNWPKSWWQHHEATALAYEENPPAQTCPATKGLFLRERVRPAEVSYSSDMKEVLLDGMPMSITQPPVPANRWYAVRYGPDSSPGYPPVLEASVVVDYRDDEGDWIAFLMEPPQGARQPRRCILRLRADEVTKISAHGSLGQALASLGDAA